MPIRAEVIGFSTLLIALPLIAQAPDFAQFSVPANFNGAPARPILSSTLQRTYRTTITRESVKGPNFAAHYRIITWMCGSLCYGFVAADSQTGKVYDPPFRWIGLPTPSADSPDAVTHPYGYEYQIDSRLLKVGGCLEDKTCGSFYYEWTGSRWNLLRSLVVGRTGKK